MGICLKTIPFWPFGNASWTAEICSREQNEWHSASISDINLGTTCQEIHDLYGLKGWFWNRCRHPHRCPGPGNPDYIYIYIHIYIYIYMGGRCECPGVALAQPAFISDSRQQQTWRQVPCHKVWASTDCPSRRQANFAAQQSSRTLQPN